MEPPPPDFSSAEAKARSAESLAAPADGAVKQSRFARSWSPEQQWEFNRATVEAMLETIRSCQAALAAQEAQLQHMEQQVGSLFVLSERLNEVHGRFDQMAADSDELAAQLREAREGFESAARERHEALERFSAEQRELMEKLRNDHQQAIDGLLAEQRERIQHLVDEQRVCIRQLSLQATEQAVLADRARRATELRLDELSARVENRNHS